MSELIEVEVLGEVVVDGEGYPIVRMYEPGDGLINAGFNPLPFPHVIVNDAAWALPSNLRLALVAHELGHHRYQHWREPDRCIKREIAADEFAVKVAGLEAVRQLLKTVCRSLKRRDMDVREIEARRDALPRCPKRTVRKTVPRNQRKRRNRRRRGK